MRNMVKIYIYVLSACLFLSCSAGKNKCESYTLDSKSAKHVQAMGDVSMYGYEISSGSLEGYILELMVLNNGMEVDAHLVHPEKRLDCLPQERENWQVKENKDNEKRTITMKSVVSIQCASKVYCFNLSFEGNMEHHPAMQENKPQEEER